MTLPFTEARTEQFIKIDLGTGWFSGDQLAINGTDASTFDIGDSIGGQIVDSSDGDNVTITPFTLSPAIGVATGLANAEEGFILITLVGDTPTVVVIRQDLYTAAQSRTHAMIGKVWLKTDGDIEGIGQYSIQAFGHAKLLEDLVSVIGDSKSIDGPTVTANVTNTQQLDKSVSTSFRLGAYLSVSPNSPNIGTDGVVENVDLYYTLKGSNTWAVTKVVDVDNYDNNGTLTTMVNNWKVVYVRFWPKSNVLGIEEAQETFVQKVEAETSIGVSAHVTNNQMYKGSFRVAVIVINKGITDLTTADFYPHF